MPRLSLNECLALLRQSLSLEPSWNLWKDLIAQLDSFPSEHQALCSEYVREHTQEHWPASVRVPNGSWSLASKGWELSRKTIKKRIASLQKSKVKELLCPAGTALIGRPDTVEQSHWSSNHSTSVAQHSVTLTRPFWVFQHPVTREVWNKVMGESFEKEGDKKDALVQVSWLEAIVFCNELSRLEGLEPVYLWNGEDWGQEKAAEWIRQFENNTDYPFVPEWKGWDVDGYRLPVEAESAYMYRAGDDGANLRYTDRPIPNVWDVQGVLGPVYEYCFDAFSMEGAHGILSATTASAKKKLEKQDRVEAQGILTETTLYNPFVARTDEDKTCLLRGIWEGDNREYFRLYSRWTEALNARSNYSGFRVCRTASSSESPWLKVPDVEESF